jgi:hypothetical protein
MVATHARVKDTSSGAPMAPCQNGDGSRSSLGHMHVLGGWRSCPSRTLLVVVCSSPMSNSGQYLGEDGVWGLSIEGLEALDLGGRGAADQSNPSRGP